MSFDPEEMKAVEAAIGKLYGYNTSAMARAVLTALVPFRQRQNGLVTTSTNLAKQPKPE